LVSQVPYMILRYSHEESSAANFRLQAWSLDLLGTPASIGITI
jgi:hypothetical protein